MKKLLLYVFLFLFCTGLCGVGQAQEYTLSMLPRYFPEKLTAMITPLAAYLSEKTGSSIKPILTANFAEYEKQINDGHITIGYENPLVYVNVSAVHEVLATAIKGQGGDKFRGIIIVRPDSGIKSIADLKDRQIMIVGKTSAGGYLSQKLSLQKQGISLSGKNMLEAADNRQENVIIAVSIGDVDAGFIRESALHKADKYIVPGSVKVLTPTAWLPNWAFSVNRKMAKGRKKALLNALLALKKDGPVLKSMGLSGFKAASDGDYDIMRKLVLQ